jgi:hypothetical protein
MDVPRHSENNNHNIDVNKLTKEAEAGHGHFVRAVLDEMSFHERLKVLRQVQKLSKEHHNRNADVPYVVLRAGVNTDADCAYMELNQHVPHKQFFGLLDKEMPVYTDCIRFPTGEENIDDDNVFE